jgi:hypothetical protein
MLHSVALVRTDVPEGMYRLDHQGDKNRRATNNVSKLATEALQYFFAACFGC